MDGERPARSAESKTAEDRIPSEKFLELKKEYKELMGKIEKESYRKGYRATVQESSPSESEMRIKDLESEIDKAFESVTRRVLDPLAERIHSNTTVK